ncbi:MAG: S9 family peptidase [Deinococcales bacterium]|nr:S9 family peptidase [Chitinophagaceae bacterium]
MKQLFVLMMGIVCVAVTNAQNGTEKIKVTDLLKVKTASGIILTSDGSKAAVTLTTIEPDGDSKLEFKYVNHIYLMPTDGSTQPKELTGKDGASQPAFSPDGKQIAFVRTVDSKPQIFLLPLDGGEAVQLTKFKYGAATPKWSADGMQLLFSASISLKDLLKDTVLNPTHAVPIWPYEKPGLNNSEALLPNTAKPNPDGTLQEIRAYLDANVTDKKAKVLHKLQFQEEATTSSEMNFTHYFIINTVTPTEPKAITQGFYSFSNAQFVPNTTKILLDAKVDDSQHPDRALETQIYSTNIDGTGFKKLLGTPNKSYNSATVSPTGKWMAYQYSNTGFISVPALAIMPFGGNETEKMDIVLDRNKGNLTWTADEKYLYFTAQTNGAVVLYRVDIATKKAAPLTDFNTGINSFAIANNQLVFTKNSVTNPSEVFISDALAKTPRQLSNFNTNWVQNKAISLPEKHLFTNTNGMQVEYWVMKPTNYQAGKKYPLLLEIHGGPSAMWGPGESSMWHEFQYFCSQGYGVVYSNPRGSGGYGLNFLKDNVNDWGAGPTNDVLTALNKTVAEGWADTSKLLITGGSYAGYLVSWIIAHDQRFKAACSQRGVYDLNTFFGEGNAWRLVPNYFGGYPWEEKVKPILARESPINYVQNITTPYIMFHGENDLRTGVIQGEMLYKSLKVLGRPVEYVRHPSATHELTRTGNNRQRIDQMLRTYEFFERWLQKK